MAEPQGNITVSGWGRLDYFGPSPEQLQFVEIPVLNYTDCMLAWWDEIGLPIAQDQLCLGENTGKFSPCHGDSGGPAVNQDGQLVGIVSWGRRKHFDYKTKLN